MIVLRIKLSKKYAIKNTGEFPIIVSVSNNRSTVDIPTGVNVLEENFLNNGIKYVKSCVPNADQINNHLKNLLSEYQIKASQLGNKAAKMTAVEVKKYLLSEQIAEEEQMSFTDYANKQLQTYTGSSYHLMEYTIRLVSEFFNGRKVFFEDITVGTLRDMDAKWSKTLKINTRGIVFRNIRAIFNRAIDDEMDVKYPFRNFTIKTAKKQKYELPAESVRKLALHQFDACENFREMARDIFLLSFYFCGANLKDIYNWKHSDVKRGKIVFVREKTERFEPETVEISIQPEAQTLIEKYKGQNYLFFFAEKYKNYDTFIGNVDKRIRTLREIIDFEKLTLYYARYTWATIAYNIGIDEKVISKSLGHQETSVAGKFYILYKWDKTDEANRKVIDHVFNYNS